MGNITRPNVQPFFWNCGDHHILRAGFQPLSSSASPLGPDSFSSLRIIYFTQDFLPQLSYLRDFIINNRINSGLDPDLLLGRAESEGKA